VPTTVISAFLAQLKGLFFYEDPARIKQELRMAIEQCEAIVDDQSRDENLLLNSQPTSLQQSPRTLRQMQLLPPRAQTTAGQMRLS
jgi:hypothetical protein